MLNAEKFKEEIEKLNYDFALAGNKVEACYSISCYECGFDKGCKYEKVKWLLSEYEEPKIESAVYNLKCDDKVEVSDDGITWHRRHFKGIEGKNIIVWAYGMTSFSARNEADITRWEYARIPREEIRHE